MTVKQLIEELEKMPQDAEVNTFFEECVEFVPLQKVVIDGSGDVSMMFGHFPVILEAE